MLSWQRAQSGVENVIHLRNGCYGLIEIKIGGESAIEHGATRKD